MIARSSAVELPGLVDDLGRNPDLADVVEQRRELCVAALGVRQPELVVDLEHEVDDVPAVAARVRVVGLDDVAEQERRSAVRVAELERVVDAALALAAEIAEQADERHHEQRERCRVA